MTNKRRLSDRASSRFHLATIDLTGVARIAGSREVSPSHQTIFPNDEVITVEFGEDSRSSKNRREQRLFL
jgi:hypothetical protein